MLYVKCLCVLSGYPRCHMLNVCVYCLVISDVICEMFVCCLVISDVICQMFEGGGGGGSGYPRCYMVNVCVCGLVNPDVIC